MATIVDAAKAHMDASQTAAALTKLYKFSQFVEPIFKLAESVSEVRQSVFCVTIGFIIFSLRLIHMLKLRW